MKKTLLVLGFALVGMAAFSQKDSGFGIKAGLNYGGNGDYFETAGDVARNPERNVGYHAGIFGKIKILKLYVRPELIYTRTTSDYDQASLDLSKLDAPVLLGINLIGPLHIFAGPSFQYILDSEFDGISINEIENDFSVGAHFGAGVNLGKLGIDVRYERGFNSNEAQFINTNITALPDSRIDTRPDQLILSLSVQF